MKNKSTKLILGIIFLLVAVIILIANIVSYWIAIAIAAIGLILIISNFSDNVEGEAPVSKTEEPSVAEKIVEPAETSAPAEEETKEKNSVLSEDKEEVEEEVVAAEEEEKKL